ncbi:IS3 family transposase [Lactobacillus salsicarnum]|nr:IS3 family transposase [Companilactobacillus mishanensis]
MAGTSAQGVKKQRRLAYQAIKEVSQNKHGSITLLLGVIGVSRQAYNKFWHRKETEHETQDKLLKKRIMHWYDLNTQTIGAGAILSNLKMDDQVTFSVTLKQVKRLMRELSIRCQSRIKKRDRIKQSEIYLRDNVLNQNFKVTSPNQVWLADSTELSYGMNGENKVRLSGVLDLYGRHLIASHLSPTETSEAEKEVFKKAFSFAGKVRPLIHTDRGSAFTSGTFNNFISGYKVTRSMSRPGTPYDNSPMERWWSEFKLRWIDRHPMPKTYSELVKLVEDGIYYFNHVNRSETRNSHTPEEYRRMAI